MAFPTVESVTPSNGLATGASGFDFSLPATINSGDLLIAIASNDGGTGENTNITGWTSLESETADVHLWALKATGSEGSTDNLSIDSNETVAVGVIRITGWSGTIADIELAYQAGDGDTTIDPASLTPTHGSLEYVWIVLGGIGSGSRGVSTWPTNYTDNQTDYESGSLGGDATIWIATRNLSASSDDPSEMTFAGNVTSASGIWTLAVKPSGGAPSGNAYHYQMNQ